MQSITVLYYIRVSFSRCPKASTTHINANASYGPQDSHVQPPVQGMAHSFPWQSTRPISLPTIRKALVVCEFVVANEATPSDIRATLRFPLPSDAIVLGCRFEVGKALVPAVTVSKKKAAAVAYVEEERGRHVGSTSAVQGNMWQMDIFPLPRGRPRRLEVSFTCPLREASAGLELHIPMSFETPLRKVTVHTHPQP